jgi:hypothetical protein
MTRLLLAAVALAALGQWAGAQPPAPVPPTRAPAINPYTLPAPVPNPNPVPQFPTYSGPPGPAIPVHKSGNVIVGLHGYYPYDTGLYLLAETGVSRQSGWFTMVYPDVAPVPEGSMGLPPRTGHTLFKHHGRLKR